MPAGVDQVPSSLDLRVSLGSRLGRCRGSERLSLASKECSRRGRGSLGAGRETARARGETVQSPSPHPNLKDLERQEAADSEADGLGGVADSEAGGAAAIAHRERAPALHLLPQEGAGRREASSCFPSLSSSEACC